MRELSTCPKATAAVGPKLPTVAGSRQAPEDPLGYGVGVAVDQEIGVGTRIGCRPRRRWRDQAGRWHSVARKLASSFAGTCQ